MAPGVSWRPLPEDAGDPPETGDTFEANALQKAEFVADWMEDGIPGGPDFLADDSGIEVDALGGRPGVWSKRYSPEATDEANRALLLEELAGVSPERRTARFRCVLALVHRQPRFAPLLFEGRCEGTIAFAARGDGGFGYDPLFLPNATPGRTMAELSPVQKDAISHRGQALRALIAGLPG